MSDDLFDEDEMASLSPKGEWMVKHKISSFAPSGDDIHHLWTAVRDNTRVTGPTEEAALLKLALKLKITFYR